MPFVEVTTVVGGTKAQAYAIAREMERYPEYMENVISVKVIEREQNSTITSWVTNVDGRSFKWKERDFFNDDLHHIRYYQVAGDLKKFEGEWRFEDTEEGTKITLTVDFDLGIPMLAGLLHPILKKKVKHNSEAMLVAIKKQVEE